jgi:hypothetical protein
MSQRVSFLLSYLTELQRVAERMKLYDEDNELLLSITQCLDSIARLQSCFCRLKERGNPSVTDEDVQDDGASSFALAECISAVSVEEQEDAAGDTFEEGIFQGGGGGGIGAQLTKSEDGNLSIEESQRLEREVGDCEECVSAIQSHVTTMIRHKIALYADGSK